MTKRGFAWGRTTPTKTESGDRPIRWNEVVALAEVLDVRLDELVKSPEYSTSESPLLDLLRADAALKSAHTRLEAARREISEAEEAYEAAWQKRQTIAWNKQGQ